MSELVLVAASGLAREVLAVERSCGRYDELLVVDDDPGLWGTSVDGAPVIGGLDAAADLGQADLVVCAGRGSARRELVGRLSGLGVPAARYARVVHPRVEVPSGCTIGAGSVLLASVVLTANVTVGSHVVVMPHVTLTHDDVVEDFATLCAGVTLGGHVRVGEAAYLGMGSCVREHVSVGRDAVLGMGAALLQPLPEAQTWVGVPARAAECCTPTVQATQVAL
jgi:sugar O-acyltransferase (sialic acid O-acetyltransferase NeuD family)